MKNYLRLENTKKTFEFRIDELDKEDVRWKCYALEKAYEGAMSEIDLFTLYQRLKERFN